MWSYLTKGDANYTLVQVSVNDLILLVAFIPIIGLLFTFFGIDFVGQDGEKTINIPYKTLITSVVVFVVIPLITGFLTNKILRKKKGEEWFQMYF